MEDIHAIVKRIPQERVQNRIMEQITDVPGQIQEKLVGDDSARLKDPGGTP